MTMKSIKVSVGLASVLGLFACTTSQGGGNGSAGASGSAGSGSAGAQGNAGAGSAGSGASGSGAAGAGSAGAGSAGNVGAAGAGSAGSGTAGAGSAGNGSAGNGTAGAGSAGNGSAGADESVLERGKRPSRDGNYVEPALTTVAAMTKMGPDATFNTNATFTGSMYASPLYLAKGPNGMGIFIAATTNGDVKAFYDSGMPAWTRSFAVPSTGQGGIMSTPVIDPQNGPDGFATIYACGQAATTGNKFDHFELHALSAKDGSERAGWPVKLDGSLKATNDGLNRTFVPTAHAQRPALSLVNSIVYIGFGGPFGDNGMYFGWVVAVDTKTPTTIGVWSTRLGGAAFWTPGGFASERDGVIVTTGNYYSGAGYSAPPTYGDSEAVIRLSGMPTALAKKDAYWPARWRQMDQDDQDLGSSSVMLLNVPGATPANYAVTVSKDSHLYINNAAALGSAAGGGEVADMQLTTTPTNHSARTSPVSWVTANGTVHFAVTVDRGPYCTLTPTNNCASASLAANCPATPVVDPNVSILMGFTVTPSPFKVTTSWCTNVGGPSSSNAGTVKNRSASPLVTTINGKDQPIVWVAGSAAQPGNTNANLLYGVDGETGAVLYKGGNCTGIRLWTTPIAVKGHIVVGGDGKLCSWSPQP